MPREHPRPKRAAKSPGDKPHGTTVKFAVALVALLGTAALYSWPAYSHNDSFERWLSGAIEEPTTLPVAISEFADTGRGLKATRSLPEGFELKLKANRVLRASSLTGRSLQRYRALGKDLPEFSRVAAALVIERFAEGGASAWAPYIAALPQATQGVLAFPPQLVASLRGFLRSAAEARRGEANSLRKAFASAAKRQPSLFAFQTGLRQAEFDWALSMAVLFVTHTHPSSTDLESELVQRLPTTDSRV
eukprot:TRINITY_DN23180_c0_g1_i1.p1 TRINITY_DN23180_c0_g1~~TRINITY_DN23180_c0_g1_i1.p1  ORF type:complete len:257 (+),score=27.55 TRINITY_DN23180_c0_g1_i1:28-771(+)